jgi:hypothetical protein
MPITLQNSNLNLQNVHPNKLPTFVDVRPASWTANATVNVQNEIGRTWRVGFVQILTRNLVRATYPNHEMSEEMAGAANLPVLDGPNTLTHRPFYDDNTVPMPQRPKDYINTLANPNMNQNIAMYDRPRSRFPWFLNNVVADRLQEVQMDLQFSTFIIARDITAGAAMNAVPYTLQVLKEWTVVLQRRYIFNVQPGLVIAGRQQAQVGQTVARIVNPNQRPQIMHTNNGLPRNVNAVFTGPIANNAFQYGIAARNRARPRGNIVNGLAQMWGG